jgi:alpha-glucosidase
MEEIPIFARGGAVIPMWPEAPGSTAGYFPAAVELHLFVPEQDGTHTSVLMEDDGLTWRASDGAYIRTTFTVTRAGSTVTLTADVEGDGYPEHARETFRLVVHGATPGVLRVDGEEISPSDGGFSLRNDGTPFAARIDL